MSIWVLSSHLLSIHPFDSTQINDRWISLQAVDRHAAEKMTDAAKEGMEQVRPKIKEAIWWDPVDGIKFIWVPYRGLKTPQNCDLSLIWVICVSYSLIRFFFKHPGSVVQDLFQQYKGVGILPLFHRNHDVMALDWNPYEPRSIFVVGFKMKQEEDTILSIGKLAKQIYTYIHIRYGKCSAISH